MPSDLPGGRWNISPTRHRAESHVLRREEEEEEEEEEGNSLLFTNQHECPLVQHTTTEQHSRASGHVWDADRPQPDPGLKSTHRVPQILWSLADEDKLKRQRQSQFLMSRRHFMNTEREQVKENNQHRKHLRRTARIKAEKEQIRQEEERKMERARQLAEARQKLEERELLILQRLKLDEDERTAELERRKRQEKGREAARYIGALRARVKERLSQGKQDLPPLCCCASSFWDSHPDTCANNCVFHNNPKAYALALQSALKGLDLQ
ncbi:coiled-coil domain-containing protein 15 [Aulostomus maculatus]